MEPFPKTDVTFLVEGKEIHVSSQILKQLSPVFRAMFELDFKEKFQERIELPEKSYKAMVEFLKCSYPFINSSITVNNVLLILPLADEYQTDLKVKCENFMINLLYGDKTVFVQRSDNYDQKTDDQEYQCYRTDIAENAAEIIESFELPEFGKQGFPVGNEIHAEKVIEYVLAAEKFKLSRLLVVATQYIAMRMFSHYEKIPQFLQISPKTRNNIAVLRLRLLEHNADCFKTIPTYSSERDRKMDHMIKVLTRK